MTDTRPAPLVNLTLAYFWECPKCGCGNYGRPVPAELTQAELQEASEEIGRELKAGECTIMPGSVRCRACRVVSVVREPEDGSVF